MSTSTIRRVTKTMVDQNDVTPWLPLELGGKFDVSVSNTWTGTVSLEYRARPGGTVIAIEAYTANTERVGELAGSVDVRLKFTTDGSGTVTAELRTGAGK